MGKFNMEKIYKINNGEMFEGTRDQFEDCYFSNANDYTIKRWCIKNNLDLKILVNGIEQIERPKVLEDIDTQSIIDTCENYLNDVENGYESKDFKEYIFEDVMIAVYGKDVFGYINEKVK